MAFFVFNEVLNDKLKLFLLQNASKGNYNLIDYTEVEIYPEDKSNKGVQMKFKHEIDKLLKKNGVKYAQAFILLEINDENHDLVNLELGFTKEREFKRKYKGQIEREKEITISDYKHILYREKGDTKYAATLLKLSEYSNWATLSYGKRVELKGIFSKDMFPTFILPKDEGVLFVELAKENFTIMVYHGGRMLIKQTLDYGMDVKIEEDMSVSDLIDEMTDDLEDIIERIEDSILDSREGIQKVYVSNHEFKNDGQEIYHPDYQIEEWGHDNIITNEFGNSLLEEGLNKSFYVSLFIANIKRINKTNYMPLKVDKKYTKIFLGTLLVVVLAAGGNFGLSTYSDLYRDDIINKESMYTENKSIIENQVNELLNSISNYEREIQDYNNYVQSIEDLNIEEEKNYVSNRLFELLMNTPDEIQVRELVIDKPNKYTGIQGLSTDYFNIGAYIKLLEDINNTSLITVDNNELYNKEGYNFHIVMDGDSDPYYDDMMYMGLEMWKEKMASVVPDVPEDDLEDDGLEEEEPIDNEEPIGNDTIDEDLSDDGIGNDVSDDVDNNDVDPVNDNNGDVSFTEKKKQVEDQLEGDN